MANPTASAWSGMQSLPYSGSYSPLNPDPNAGGFQMSTAPSYQAGAMSMPAISPSAITPTGLTSGIDLSGPGTMPIDMASLTSMGSLPDLSKMVQGKDGSYYMPGDARIGGAAGGAKGMIGQDAGKLGMNAPTLQLGLQGIGTLGNLWASFQAQKMAREQFKYQKSVSETNLANQIGSYNTALGDKARSRAIVEGQTDAQRDAYIEANKAVRR